jgi:DNA modification methylase
MEFQNTFYHGDCLFVMKHDIAPESVDLIYLDPPFFTGKTQKGKWMPEAMEVSFEDSKQFWKEKGVQIHAPEWIKHIATSQNRPDFASYLYYMMQRLRACYTVLEKTGSIWLHCDWRASHYLKMVMDEVFTVGCFRNEIIWHYSGWNKKLSDKFESRADSILFYVRSDKQKEKFHSGSEKWTSKDEYVRVRKQKVRTDGKGREYVLSDAGGGKRVKRYLDEAMASGRPIDNVWNIDKINNSAEEFTGYPTQKPEALLRRIIKCSTDDGDIVLDPFCGCGTTIIAASKENRRFIGIDIDTSRRKGGLPTAYRVISNRSHRLLKETRYITRDIAEVLEMNPLQFEDWVNEYYKADKPHPDKGIDGVTQDGIPIQVKTFQVSRDVLSQFVTDVKYHANVPKPIKKVIIASQMGFDDGARQRKFEIETAEGIAIELATPQDMLILET